MRTLNDVLGMNMTSVPEKPPNWDQIIKVFPHVEHRRGILFAWGDKIYNPDKVPIPAQLLAHECTHSLQQKQWGGPEEWWRQYLSSDGFRYEQELEAHCVEYQAYCQFNNRKFRSQGLAAIAERLAGPLYGSLVKWRSALEIIRAERDNYEPVDR